jgi:hypothetical protein
MIASDRPLLIAYPLSVDPAFNRMLRDVIMDILEARLVTFCQRAGVGERRTFRPGVERALSPTAQ